MKLIAKIYEEDGRVYVVHSVPIDHIVVDLMSDAWSWTHGEMVRLDCERVKKAKEDK